MSKQALIALLTLFAAFALVGRMDYADQRAQECAKAGPGVAYSQEKDRCIFPWEGADNADSSK